VGHDVDAQKGRPTTGTKERSVRRKRRPIEAFSMGNRFRYEGRNEDWYLGEDSGPKQVSGGDMREREWRGGGKAKKGKSRKEI